MSSGTQQEPTIIPGNHHLLNEVENLRAELFALQGELSRVRQTEQALLKSRDLLRQLFGQMPGGFALLELIPGPWESPADYLVLEANTDLERYAGLDKGELVGKRLWKAAPAMEPECKEVLDWTAMTGDSGNCEISDPRGEGRLEVAVMRLQPNRLALSISDVSAHGIHQETLKESNKRYQDLFSSTGNLAYTHDFDGRLLSASRAVSAILGYGPEELLSMKIQDLMPAKNRRRFEKDYMNALKKQGHHESAGNFCRKDGTLCRVEFRSWVVTQRKREPYISGSGRDVTEKTLAVRQQKAPQARLLQAVKMGALGILAGGATQDFRNILRAISGYVQGVSADRKRGPVDVHEVEKAVVLAGNPVQRVMTSGPKAEPKLKAINLNQEIRLAVELLERTIPKMIRVRTHLEDGIPAIKADAAQLGQVVMILAANAQDAMPEGGELTISTSSVSLGVESARIRPRVSPGNYVVVTVAATGKGMDEMMRQGIFEPQRNTNKARQDSGLEFSTALDLVEAHHGHITCLNSPGEGTSFSVHFPVLTATAAVPEKSIPMGSPVGGRETLLLVDEEETILLINSDMMKEHGYQVRTASSGKEAVKIYQNHGQDIDLVIMDLGMSGLEERKGLQEILAIDPDANVIIISGDSSEDLISSPMQHRAVGFLAKPYLHSQLMAKLREFIETGATR